VQARGEDVVGVIAAPNLPPPLGLVVGAFSGNFPAIAVPRRPAAQTIF
jgi:hypothetical protein